MRTYCPEVSGAAQAAPTFLEPAACVARRAEACLTLALERSAVSGRGSRRIYATLRWVQDVRAWVEEGGQ